MYGMVKITGNTYSVRNQIRALGGRWSQAQKAWFVPPAVAEQAQALAGKPSGSGRGRAPRVCATCGQRINYGIYCGKCEFSR